MDATDKKISEFLNLLQKRTIDPIDNTDIKESCTATLLMIFAAIDSLSKITCTDDEYKLFKNRKGNKIRFTNFLEKVMGLNYARFKNRIYDLRNDVVHTGINTKVVLSKNAYDGEHLQEVDGYLWINTNKFLDDFKDILTKIHRNIEAKDIYFQNAANRLQEFNIIKIEREPMPSPGAADEVFK